MIEPDPLDQLMRQLLDGDTKEKEEVTTEKKKKEKTKEKELKERYEQRTRQRGTDVTTHLFPTPRSSKLFIESLMRSLGAYDVEEGRIVYRYKTDGGTANIMIPSTEGGEEKKKKQIELYNGFKLEVAQVMSEMIGAQIVERCNRLQKYGRPNKKFINKETFKEAVWHADRSWYNELYRSSEPHSAGTTSRPIVQKGVKRDNGREDDEQYDEPLRKKLKMTIETEEEEEEGGGGEMRKLLLDPIPQPIKPK